MEQWMSDASNPAWGTGEPVAGILFSPGSPVYRGAVATAPFGPFNVPAQYSSPRAEFLAARSTAWLGILLNSSPVYDVSGPDAVTFLNSVAVNRDFGRMADGASRHMLLCNDDGLLLADGVAVKIAENHFRTYWLAPVLDFRLRASDLDVEGTWIHDEYFFQVDGPKSLEIFEKVTGQDLHELAFAHNTRVTLGGGPATVHRLGMSGALAYEVHGHSSFALAAYEELRSAVEEAGGAVQGFLNYALVNHTVAGYPNQFQHFLYPYNESGAELRDYMSQVPHLDLGLAGSAEEDRTNAYVTPFDIGWGGLVDFGHEFPGKAALQAIAANPPRRAVTLEWDADDVGAAFAAQLRGDDAVVYDPLYSGTFTLEDFSSRRMRIDYVLSSDGEKIGVTAGRTIDYLGNRMISLAFLDSAQAMDGAEVVVLWGRAGGPQARIRARIAPMPYYRGEFRNETFDTSQIPSPVS